MTEFLIYQGKAAIALAVFYMFYRLLLSKETFHRFNRIVLLGTAALSFVLPLCVITFKEVVVVPAMTASSENFTGEVPGLQQWFLKYQNLYGRSFSAHYSPSAHWRCLYMSSFRSSESEE